MTSSVYLDWNATTPLHPDVAKAMRAAEGEGWANPSSLHAPGRRARAHLDAAREAVAALVGLDARDVTLTSGGTEANNLALTHPFPEGAERGALVVSRLEHPSVVRVAEALADRGTHVVWTRVEPSGALSVDAVLEAIEEASGSAPVRLVSVQAVNHETGVLQPIPELAEALHARGLPLHVDAVQAVGKLPPAAFRGADLVSLAAHKFRGPKGIGALATAPGVRLRPVLLGGGQERGFRPGTQDPVAAAGLAAAAVRARETPERYAALASLRDRLEAELLARLPAAGRNGHGLRAPHVANLSIPGWRGDELCAALDLEGVAASSGSACSAGTAEPSPVLTAMLGEARASSAVRLSLGDTTTADDVERALAAFATVLARR